MSTSSRQREAIRREKAAALRRAEEARRRRRMRIIVTASVVGVLVLVAVIGIVVQATRTKSGPVVAPPAVTAFGAQSGDGAGGASFLGGHNGGAYTVGSANAKVTVDLYEDFQCPACESFETQTGSTVQQLINSGRIKGRYHILSFIDDNAGGTYSARSANAAACVQANAPARFNAFHGALYAHQPKEGSNPPTSEILAAARGIGITGDAFTRCVNSNTYKNWVSKVQDEASKAGVNSTPTIFVNGRQISGNELLPQGFTAAVNTAAGQTK